MIRHFFSNAVSFSVSNTKAIACLPGGVGQTTLVRRLVVGAVAALGFYPRLSDAAAAGTIALAMIATATDLYFVVTSRT
jgi:hypothetical protein